MYRSSPYDRANLIADFDSIRISLASPEKIQELVARQKLPNRKPSIIEPLSRSVTGCSAPGSSDPSPIGNACAVSTNA